MDEFELSFDSIEEVTDSVTESSEEEENATLSEFLEDDSDEEVEEDSNASKEASNDSEESEEEEEIEDSEEEDTNIFKLAKALKEEGILDEDDDIEDVKSPDAFKSMMENHISKKLGERYQRIEQALEYKMPTDVIKNFESTLNYLTSLTSENISAENTEGENIRKQLIFQDYINRGFSEEKARKEVKKAFDAGTDIEDAVEAWQANYDFFTNNYQKEIEKRKSIHKKQEEESRDRIEQFKKDLIENKDAFGGIDVDKNTRQKIFNLIYNPTTTNSEGKKVSELTKFFQEKPTDVYKYMALFYNATDKFTNFNKLFKSQVNREMKKGLAKLEETINGSARTSSGSLNLSNGKGGKSAGTLFNNNWDIDL